MKDINQVCELLELTNKQIKNMIDPNRGHRYILNRLGCRIEKNRYLFSPEGIKYIAYQYMSKNNSCFYYIYPDKKIDIAPKTPSKKPVNKIVTKKMLKQIRK